MESVNYYKLKKGQLKDKISYAKELYREFVKK